MKIKQKEDEIINLQQKLRIMSQKYEKLHSKFDKMNINQPKELSKKSEENIGLRNEKAIIKEKYDELQLKLNKFIQSNNDFCFGINSYFNIPSNPKGALHYFL